MDDIAPALLAGIQEEFNKRYANDQKTAALRKQINDGKGTYRTADEFAARVGDILKEALHDNVSPEVLPDGRMYYNIASRVLAPVLENNYELTAEAAKKVQEALNKAAGIGIRAQVPDLNTDRIDGIIELAANAPEYAAVEKELLSSVVNFTQSVVTDSVKKNADFHYQSGLSPKIVRTAEAGACAWCRELAGTYDYSKVSDTGNDVWRRHRDCRCNVEYDPGNGSRQNAHTKMWRGSEERDKMIMKGLRAVSGSGVKTHKPPIQGADVDINDEAAIQDVIDLYEKININSKIETALVITKDGKVYHCFGTAESVYPDEDLGEKIRGAIISHNHPIEHTEYTFSNDDIELFEKYELKRLRGVDKKYTYELNRNKADIDEISEDWQSEYNFEHCRMIQKAQERRIGYKRWEND